MIVIPLLSGSENAHQRFSMQLGNNFLDLEFNYISYLEYAAWSMNVYRDGTPLVLGAMLEPNADVIENYKARIGSFVFTGKQATLDNIGTENTLTWVA